MENVLAFVAAFRPYYLEMKALQERRSPWYTGPVGAGNLGENMIKPEKALWALCKDKLPGARERIENIAGTGLPDVSGTYEGKDYWIELKADTKKSALKSLRPTQHVWAIQRLMNGCKNIFLLHKENKNISLYSLHMSGTEELGLQASLLCRMASPYNWECLKKTIKESLK